MGQMKIVASEEVDLDDLVKLASAPQPSITLATTNTSTDGSSSFMPRLTSLDENAPDMDSSNPSALSNVKELELSLSRGKVPVPIRRSGGMVDSSQLSKSLMKSKTPITIQKEDIDKLYHVYYTSELGRGKNSIVRKAIERSSGKQFAVKTVMKRDKAEADHMRKEIDLLSDLDHRSIIDLHAAYEDDTYLHMVMELAQGGELHEYVMDLVKTKKSANGKVHSKNEINEQVAAAIVRKVVDAVAYLHEHNIVHRDMKLENIVFSSKLKPSFKDGATMDTNLRLIDFGLSKRYDTHRSFGSLNKLGSFVGTNYYLAPEVLESEYTHSCDLWSLGVLAYALLSGRPPFYGKDNDEIFEKIRNFDDESGVQFPASDWSDVSEDAKNFIRQLLVKDEKQRPSALELRRHPWIKDALKNDKISQKVGFFKKAFGFGKKKRNKAQ